MPGKSNVNCCVVGCSNKYSNLPAGLKLFRFPQEKKFPVKYNLWVTAIRRTNKDGTNWKPGRNARICSAHFVNNEKANNPKSPSFVPTIFPKIYRKDINEKAVRSRYERYQRRQTNIVEDVGPIHSQDMTPSSSHDDMTLSPSQDIATSPSKNTAFNVDKGIQVCFETFDDSSAYNNVSYMFCAQIGCTEVSTQTCISDIAEQMKVACECTQTRNKEFKSVGCGPNTADNNETKGFQGFSSIHDDQALKDLTGVGRVIFMILLSMLKEPRLASCKIKMEDRLLITLMKLKHGLTFSSLGVLFSLHRSTVSRMFLSALNDLHERTRCFIFWPSRKSIERTMPDSFKKHFPRCQAIIDCTETKIEIPSQTEQQVLCFSNYKNMHTVKFLVSCTPNGMVSFCSPCYGGRASDAFITVDSGFLNYIKPGDIVLADKGFPQIASVLSEHKALLIMPSFSQKDCQFTKEEVEHTYNVASVRIHVERCIQRIKCFRILDKIHSELLPHVDKVVSLCCVLANLSAPLIKQ